MEEELKEINKKLDKILKKVDKSEVIPLFDSYKERLDYVLKNILYLRKKII